jgi:hypothetical protein
MLRLLPSSVTFPACPPLEVEHNNMFVCHYEAIGIGKVRFGSRKKNRHESANKWPTNRRMVVSGDSEDPTFRERVHVVGHPTGYRFDRTGTCFLFAFLLAVATHYWCSKKMSAAPRCETLSATRGLLVIRRKKLCFWRPFLLLLAQTARWWF